MPLTALTFSGRETFKLPPETLFARITDLDQMVTSIPGLESSKRVDAQTVQCVIRPGFSFLRGTVNAQIRLVDSQPPKSARMEVAASGIGLSMRIESTLEVGPTADGSQLDWTATVVELKGLVATLSRPLISSAADQVIRGAWRKLHDSLGDKP